MSKAAIWGFVATAATVLTIVAIEQSVRARAVVIPFYGPLS